VNALGTTRRATLFLPPGFSGVVRFFREYCLSSGRIQESPMGLLKNYRKRGGSFGFVGIHFTGSDSPEVPPWRGLELRKMLTDEMFNHSTMSEVHAKQRPKN
jgi:hypothetical protein